MESSTDGCLVVAGSGVAAARCLANGRRVRSKLSGYLGVVLEKQHISDANDSQSSAAKPELYHVRLADQRVFWYTREQIEPWTRGVYVTSNVSGKQGEILRVDQRVPPSPRPYLVRLDDGREFWYALDSVAFLAIQPRRSSYYLDVTRGEKEHVPLTLVPGQWCLHRSPIQQGPDSTGLPLTLSLTLKGEVHATGQDCEHTVGLKGTARDSMLNAQLHYTECEHPHGPTTSLAGAWEIKDFGLRPRWAVVDRNHVSIAGTDVGTFQVNASHIVYTDRASGTTHRVLMHGADLLCWDDDSMWCRLPSKDGSLDISAPCNDSIPFDPPKCSQQEDGGTCEISRMDVAPGGALSIVFETSCAGLMPDALKTQLRIDGRIIEAATGEFMATVVKKKSQKSHLKGELRFDDVCPRCGSAVSLRFGGEFSGYSWAELVSGSQIVADLEASLYLPHNPLRAQHLAGPISSDGRSAEVLIGEGPRVSVTGKTASSICMSHEGRLTTLSHRPYGNDEKAQICVRGPAVIRFTFFKTEATYDTMEIAGEEYSGDELPPSYVVPEGKSLIMTWTSDGSTTDEGWEFTVRTGISHVKFANHEVEFGAREAPWNQEDASCFFAAPIAHVQSNAWGLEQFDSADVSGRVVLMRMDMPAKNSKIMSEVNDEQIESDEVEAEGLCETSDAQEAELTDHWLFMNTLRTCVANAELAGACSVMFVSTCASPPAIVPILEEDVAAESLAPPSIPAVIVGWELGQQILSALDSGEAVATGPSTRRCRMSIQQPLVLDGSRDRTKIALDNPNFLRAIYVANSKLHLEEDEDFMATFSLPKDAKELFAIVRSACRHIKMDSAVEAAMECAWQMTITQEMNPITSEHDVEAFFQEVLRRLMPIKCPPAALLPGLERHGEVWDHYCKGRCLGEGSFGTVNQACDRFTGSQVAIKEIKLEDKEDKTMEESKLEIVKEFELLRDLSHPNLLRVFDLYITDSTLFLVTEFAPCGDLNRYVSSPSKVDERWVAAVTRQVLSACGYLHRHQIVHHDVKPANVLITASFLDAPEEKVPVVLLADFGLSRMENFIAHEAQKAASACYGTPCYMPPESSHGLSGPKTDVYATGILLYEMLSGGHAPEPVSDEGDVADVDWSLLAHCSSDAITTTKALMAPLVGDRFSCKDALQLEWLWPRPSSYNEDAVEAVETGSNELQASSDVKCEGAAKLSMNVESKCNLAASGYGSSLKIDATAIRTTMTAIEQGVAKLSTNVDCNFLSRVAMNMLAIQLPRAELENARQIFLALDSDRDGVLSEADLVSAFAHCGRGNAAAKEALFAADIRRQGILEFCEVAAACIDVALLPQGIVYGISEKMFAQLHGPDNGVAYLSLLERFAGEDECDDDNLTDMLHRCDSHGDGHLTKEDFFKIWGLELLPDWRTPSPPEPPLASVRMLRGDVNVCHIEGGVVMSQNFATFGQPSCARSSGRWYYEVHIRKYESPQIGWADEDFVILQEPCDNGVGDDAHSWGVDGERLCKWHDGQDAYEPSIPWAHPLVLGCALNLGSDGRRQMFFSVDGQWDSTPAFQDFAIDGALYPAGSGILDGRFCFKSSECVFQPPDSTYDYLET